MEGVCLGRATSWSALRIHFMHHHMCYMLVVLDEGSHLLLCCPKCDIFFTWRELNRYHQATAMCTRLAEREMKRLREEEVRMIMPFSFQAYG